MPGADCPPLRGHSQSIVKKKTMKYFAQLIGLTILSLFLLSPNALRASIDASKEAAQG